MMNSSNTKLGARLRHFFYAEEVPYGLALIRMVLPMILLVVMSFRWIHARELYSQDGAPAPIADNFGVFDMLPIFSGTVTVALFSAMLIAFLFSAIGWCTRLSLICSTVLYTYFCLIDYLSTITKFTVIATHVLLLLSLSQCGIMWSVDSWLKRRARKSSWPGEPTTLYPRASVWPRRLIQILVCTVYFGAAATKVQTPSFFSGDQMIYWAMTNVNHAHPLGELFTLYPILFVFGGFATAIWEILFSVLVWSKIGRRFALGGGVIFHIGTMLLLGLFVFPWICFSTYFSFLEERDIQGFAASFRRWRRRFGGLKRSLIPQPVMQLAFRLQNVRWYHSPLSYAFVTVTLIMIAVESEYRMDVYGMRRPEGPYSLKVIDDPELIARMMKTSEPIRDEDKFLAFDIGTGLVAGHLVNRRDTFTQGESVIAQCSLSPPHEDMWVECNLHDADGPIIDRVGNVITRELARTEFVYNLSESLEPGDYMLVIRTKGREITRRYFTLLPKLTAHAN
ncbi:MAG: HTTM domain-containing protein [Planctomycetota bacterium]|nr:HTTM domain-containing protein [Planctomycetota bacterium]